MKRIKSFKLFENVDEIKETVENLLRDISDDDIPVDVAHFTMVSDESKVMILIGEEDAIRPNSILLENYVDNFISLHNYLTEEGFQLKNFACWIKPTSVPVSGVKPITVNDFDKFLEKVEEIKEWNETHPPIEWRNSILIDIMYIK